jgi:5-methylcytosine-specific restriction endonuclease McrA
MPKKITNKKELKQLDDIWKKKVKERDNWTCQVCGKKVTGHNCQAHHIIPKIFKTCRWDVNNGITLCFQHHKVGQKSPHMNAIWFTFWLKTNKYSQFRYIISKLKEIEMQKK